MAPKGIEINWHSLEYGETKKFPWSKQPTKTHNDPLVDRFRAGPVLPW